MENKAELSKLLSERLYKEDIASDILPDAVEVTAMETQLETPLLPLKKKAKKEEEPYILHKKGEVENVPDKAKFPHEGWFIATKPLPGWVPSIGNNPTWVEGMVSGTPLYFTINKSQPSWYIGSKDDKAYKYNYHIDWLKLATEEQVIAAKTAQGYKGTTEKVKKVTTVTWYFVKDNNGGYIEAVPVSAVNRINEIDTEITAADNTKRTVNWDRLEESDGSLSSNYPSRNVANITTFCQHGIGISECYSIKAGTNNNHELAIDSKHRLLLLRAYQDGKLKLASCSLNPFTLKEFIDKSFENIRLRGEVEKAGVLWKNEELDTIDRVRRVLASNTYNNASLANRFKRTLGSSDSLLPLVGEFYLASHMMCIQPSNILFTRQRNRVAAVLADKLAKYAIYACFGEARHGLVLAANKGITWKSDVVNGMTRASGSSISREGAWDVAYIISQYLSPVEILDGLVEIFNNGMWSNGGRSSFGGLKWGNIAELARDFYTGKLSRVTYIDTTISAVHNGGWAMNKYFNTHIKCCDKHSVVGQLNILDTKAANVLDLYTQICTPHWAVDYIEPMLKAAEEEKSRKEEEKVAIVKELRERLAAVRNQG